MPSDVNGASEAPLWSDDAAEDPVSFNEADSDVAPALTLERMSFSAPLPIKLLRELALLRKLEETAPLETSRA